MGLPLLLFCGAWATRESAKFVSVFISRLLPAGEKALCFKQWKYARCNMHKKIKKSSAIMLPIEKRALTFRKGQVYNERIRAL